MADKKFDFLNKIGLGNAWTNIKNYISSFTYSKTELNTKLDEKASDDVVVHKTSVATEQQIKDLFTNEPITGARFLTTDDVCTEQQIKDLFNE